MGVRLAMPGERHPRTLCLSGRSRVEGDVADMLYFLGQLGESLAAFNVFRYITFRTAGAVVTALFFVFLFGPGMIAGLRVRQGRGQPIREDGPQGHLLTKKGTPTMGGLMILAGTVTSILLWCEPRQRLCLGACWSSPPPSAPSAFTTTTSRSSACRITAFPAVSGCCVEAIDRRHRCAMSSPRSRRSGDLDIAVVPLRQGLPVNPAATFFVHVRRLRHRRLPAIR